MMKECKICGVIFEKETDVCPLCGANGKATLEEKLITSNSPVETYIKQEKENRKYLWELTGIVSFSAILACLSVDILTGKGLGWSLYAVISIVAAWIILTLLLKPPARKVISFSILAATVLSALMVYDLSDSRLDWFLIVGMPITLGAILIIIGLEILWNRFRMQGFDFLGALLTGAILLCIVTEICVDHLIYGYCSVRWSLIVTVSVLPVVFVLLFLNYRMKRGKQLKSYFHV